ncbi:MAG: hypothetical protein WBO17_02210 [Sphingorhabdus sp.]
MTMLFAMHPVHALAAESSPLASTAETPADPDQQIKCRKIQVSGSLIRKIRTCRTIAEWRRAQQEGNDAARAIVGENVCSGGECRGYEPPPAPE